MTSSSTNLSEFVAAVAAKQPTPGGGAVAGVVGALAAAIGEMAVNYSVGKKGLESCQPALESSLRHLTAARMMMLQLAAEDQLAFEASQALKKGGAGPDELAAALLTAIRVPQAIAATAAAVLDQAVKAAPIANRWLLSDLAVCAELAMATVRCGTYNVRVNLNEDLPATDREQFRSWCEVLQHRCVRKIGDLIPLIWNRIENG
ncbi:MAG TPA: cyclodeaminase/cyclohydrolase family protein [Tepidisphaeraceae bacterium]|nr:cyclodeaminase/cyclohydrolase family protein [Tepidisphaeraceae bacterium]